MQTIPVIIIEDEPKKAAFYRNRISNFFNDQSLGVTFKTFTNKEEWHTHGNGSIPGDVYLVDINLGQNREEEGIEIIQTVLTSTPKTDVFAITGYPHTKERIEQLGAKFFLKSGDPTELKDCIHEIGDAIRKKAK